MSYAVCFTCFITPFDINNYRFANSSYDYNHPLLLLWLLITKCLF